METAVQKGFSQKIFQLTMILRSPLLKILVKPNLICLSNTEQESTFWQRIRIYISEFFKT